MRFKIQKIPKAKVDECDKKKGVGRRGQNSMMLMMAMMMVMITTMMMPRM